MNMLKVASLRLASMKGKLEEIGEAYEDITSVSKNQTQIYNLTKGQVNILDEQNGKLKDTYTILGDVAKAWNDVNDLDKSSLLELIFGKQRANQGAAIIQAFQSGQIQKALKDAMTSNGSAYEENEKWLNSIQAKTQQFEAAFQSLSNTVIDSDLIKFFIDLGTSVTNVLNELIKFLGSIGTLSAIGGGLLGVKGFGIFSTKNNELAVFKKTLHDIKKDFSTGQSISSIFNSSLTQKDIAAISNYTTMLKQGVQTGQAWEQTMTSCSVAAKQNVLQCKNSVAALEKMTVAQTANTRASKAGAIALKGLAVAGNMIAFFAIVKGIELAAKAIDNYVHSNEIAISKASELKSAFESSISTINEHQSSLDSLSDRFTELSKGVDNYGNNVSLTKEQLEEYNGLIKDLIAINPTLVKGYDAENQAIIDKNSAISNTIELLERERQLELEKSTSSSNLKTIGEGAIAKRNKLYGNDFVGQFGSFDLETVSGQASRFGKEAAKLFNDETVKAFFDYTNSRPFEKMYGKSDWLKSLGFNVSDEDVDLDIEGYLQRNIDTFSKHMDEILAKANIDPTSDQAKNLKLYVQEWQALNTELASIDSSYIDEHLQKIPQFVNEYDTLTNSQKSFIGEYIRNGFSAYDLTDNAVKVKSSILGVVEGISSDEKVKSAINSLFTLDTKDLNVTDYVNQYKEILDNVISQLNISNADANSLRLKLTVDADDLATKYENAIKTTTTKFDGYDPIKFFEDNSINTQEEIDAWLGIAQAAGSAEEAERKYIEQGKTISPPSFIPEFENLPTDKIEEYISLVKSGNIDEGTISSFLELNDLMQKTGMSAEDAAKALKDYADGYKLSTDLTSNIQAAYDLLKGVEEQYKKTGLIGLSSLESIANKYPQLRSAVNEYTQGLISADEMILQLQTAYDNDAIVYKAAMSYKLSGDKEFFSAIYNNNKALFNDLANAYGLDVQNWKTMAQAKTEIDQKLIKSLSSAWSKYYNIVFDSASGMASFKGQDIGHGSSHGSTMSEDQQKAWSEATAQVNKYNQIIRKLNEAANITVETPDFGGIGSLGSRGGSGKERSKKDYSEVFDWVATTIDRVNEKVEALQNKILDTSNWKSKNALTNTTIDEMSNKLTALQLQADTYQEKANSYDLSPTYIDKIKNGTLEIETITDEVIGNNIKNYQEWYNKAEEVRKQIDKTKKSMQELAKSRLDNIINDFNSLVSLMNKYSSYSENLINLQKELGKDISSNDYQNLINQQEAIYNQLQSKYNNLSSELSKAVSSGTIKVGEEEWRKYQEELISVNSEMNDAVSSMNDFRKAMINLPFEELERLSVTIDRMNNGISTMSDLIGDDGLMDGGMLTSKGLAKIALLGKQYANAKQQAADYAEAINAVNEMYENGSLTQDEYNKKLNDYTNSQLSAVKTSKEAEQAILQFKYNAIQSQIDDMNDLITAKKEALQTEKDYQNYLESITEKQTDINNLQAKIDELSLSTSRQDIAQRLQLEQQLLEAKKDLSDTKADYAYDKTLESLDKQASDYEEAKNKELEDLKSNTDAQQKVIKDYLGQVKDNYNTVYKTLTKYGTDYNVTMTSELTSPWESANSAVYTFQDAISDAVSQINIDIANIDLSKLTELVSTMQGFSADGSGSSFEDVTGSGSWQKTSKGWWYGSSNDDYVSDGIYTIGGKQYNFNEDGYMKTGWDESTGQWRYFEPENGQMVKSAWRKSKDGKEYYLKSDGTMATDMAIKAKSGDGYYYVNDDGVWNGETLSYDEVKQRKITVGYKNGTQNSKPGLKEVNEDGAELIVSKDGTAILNSTGGDTVFDHDATKRLWEISHNPELLSKFKHNISSMLNVNIPKYDFSNIKTVNREPIAVQITSPLMTVNNTDERTMGLLNNRLKTFATKELPDIMRKDMKGR